MYEAGGGGSSFPGLVFLTWQPLNREGQGRGLQRGPRLHNVPLGLFGSCPSRREVRLVESCQVPKEPRLGIPRPWQFLSIFTQSTGSWGVSIRPSRSTLHSRLSLLCSERPTSVDFTNTLLITGSAYGGPWQGK